MMITGFRRFLAAYLPVFGAAPLAVLLAASPWYVTPSVTAAIVQAVTCLVLLALFFAATRPVAAQRLACFDWQAELIGLKRESAARVELMEKMKDAIGTPAAQPGGKA